MNEIDAMRLLAEANPVQAEDLAPVGTPSSVGRRLPRRPLAVVLVLAAVAAVGTFAFSGSSSGVRDRVHGHVPDQYEGGIAQVPGTGWQGPTGGTGPTPANGGQCCVGTTGSRGTGGRPSHEGSHDVSFKFNRSEGALSSVDVSVFVYPKRSFKIEVRYLGPRGDYLQGGYPVVYRMDVSADSLSQGTGGVGPSGAMGPGGKVSWDWSGTLSVSDWKGGCKSGDYEIDWDFGTSKDFRIDTSTDTFSCTGN